MPAATASRRLEYSDAAIAGTLRDAVAPLRPCGPPPRRAATEIFFVGGKLSHCLRDLLRVGHEELFMRCVERHRGDVGSGDSSDGAVQAVERVLRDDGRDLGAEPTG